MVIPHPRSSTNKSLYCTSTRSAPSLPNCAPTRPPTSAYPNRAHSSPTTTATERRAISSAHPLFEEGAERVQAVATEGSALDVAVAAIERERFWLPHPRLEADPAHIHRLRLPFQSQQNLTPELPPANGRRHEHTLDLGRAIAADQQGPATDRDPADAGHQEAHVVSRQLHRGQQVIASGRIEACVIGVGLSKQC